jgi:hypothetical protein
VLTRDRTMARITSARHRFATMLFGPFLSSCTTVILHGEGQVFTERYFGVVQVVVSEQRTTSIALSGFGITLLPGALSLGWTDWKAVSIGTDDTDQCLLVKF